MFTAEELGITQDAFERAQKIKLLLMDVDGVLTDGNITWLPTPETQPEAAAGLMSKLATATLKLIGIAPKVKSPKQINGENFKAKSFGTQDSSGLHMCRMAGIKTGIISGSQSTATFLWATHQRVNFIELGNWDKKLESVLALMKEEGLAPEEVAFIGDDIIDVKAMRAVGFAIAVRNARQEVKDIAHYTTANPGGHGAVREAIELLIKAKGYWPELCAEFHLGPGDHKHDKIGFHHH